MIRIRRWTGADAEASYAVYLVAVRNGADRHYDEAQRLAWVPSGEMEAWWAPRLSAAQTWVTSDEAGLSGLIALGPDGHLDLFFVSPRARGNETAARLYETLLGDARAAGFKSLSCHASDYLKPFLENRGWRVIDEEQAECAGVMLRRWHMSLDQPAGSQRS